MRIKRAASFQHDDIEMVYRILSIIILKTSETITDFYILLLKSAKYILKQSHIYYIRIFSGSSLAFSCEQFLLSFFSSTSLPAFYVLCALPSDASFYALCVYNNCLRLQNILYHLEYMAVLLVWKYNNLCGEIIM